jgi:hypothetical protein
LCGSANCERYRLDEWLLRVRFCAGQAFSQECDLSGVMRFMLALLVGLQNQSLSAVMSQFNSYWLRAEGASEKPCRFRSNGRHTLRYRIREGLPVTRPESWVSVRETASEPITSRQRGTWRHIFRLRAAAIAVGSEEARLRAGLRPPLKLHVRVSRMQLSRRFNRAG